MKMISKTIAMLLVLVMLASGFISCDGETNTGSETVWYYVAATMLIGLLTILYIVDADLPNETGVYLARMGQDNYSLEYLAVKERFDSLPQAERLAFEEKINSLSAKKRASLVSTVNVLPQSEIIVYMRELNALTDEEFISVVQDFNSLDESGMDLLLNQINQRAARFLMGTVAFERKRIVLEPVLV